MILKRIQVKSGLANLVTNSYVICDEKTKDALVVDPGGEPEKIIEILEILEANLKYIYLTHCHVDHICGVQGLKNAKCGKVLISRDDYDGLQTANMSEKHNMVIPEFCVDSRVDDGDLIHVGELELKVILTPGHTKGSSSLYCEKEKFVLTGDTLFSGTIGRTDLPTGNNDAIIDSLKNKLLTLPDETIVYPGHGKITMISDEKN